MEIRKLDQSEKADAMQLVWSVFLEYEAPDYVEEGIRTFHSFISNKNEMNGLEMYGAFIDGSLVGVIATRNEGSHISLFFVDGSYHRRGIGRRLFDEVRRDCAAEAITVNSSPYATQAYHQLGFVDIDAEQMKNGIRFTPMKYRLSGHGA